MDLIESIKATYAVIGQEITDLGLQVMAEELTAYPLPAVQTALSRCRKELRKLTLSDVLDRLPDGHPGVEEAWSIVSKGMTDGGATIVWTDEMREAYGVALGVQEDQVASRMAFKETYIKLVQESRSMAHPPKWCASLGADKLGREIALLEGVEKGRLTPAYAQKFLGAMDHVNAVQFLEQHFPRLLE